MKNLPFFFLPLSTRRMISRNDEDDEYDCDDYDDDDGSNDDDENDGDGSDDEDDENVDP